MSFPLPDHAILPQNISPRAAALADDTSLITQDTRALGLTRQTTQPQVGSPNPMIAQDSGRRFHER